MIRDKNGSQGIPGVRGFRRFHILPLLLSPQGEGLRSLAHVRLFPDR